jgi:hypothetical protein
MPPLEKLRRTSNLVLVPNSLLADVAKKRLLIISLKSHSTPLYLGATAMGACRFLVVLCGPVSMSGLAGRGSPTSSVCFLDRDGTLKLCDLSVV